MLPRVDSETGKAGRLAQRELDEVKRREGIAPAARRGSQSSLEFDRNFAPHSMTGPAIRYADGLEVYALHGRRVPVEFIGEADMSLLIQATLE